jgi:tetratricopeptide (TPR) repeat protein
MITAVGLQAFGTDFAVHDAATRRGLVRDLLREQRLLVILDNFESVRSMPELSAAVDEADCTELKDFLAHAATGRSMLLVTSRSPETWMGDVRRIHVGGLRDHEAIEYAGLLLDPFPAAAARRDDRAFGELLEWLDGHPLSMRLTMPQLEESDAATILSGLRGAAPLPEADDSGRTTSLPASIAYSMKHLDEADRQRLVAISLFHGTVNARILAAFSARDQVPRRFSGTDAAGWEEVLERAARVGLLTTQGAGMYGIHPALPAYLTEHWRSGEPEIAAAEQAAARRALLDAYASYGRWLTQQIDEGDAGLAYRLIDWQRRTLGHMLADALSKGLWAQALAIATPLNEYWNRSGMAAEADAWAERAQLALEGPEGTPPPPDDAAGLLWRFFLGAKGQRLNLSGQHDAAAEIYTKINEMVAAQPDWPGQQTTLAIGYHQLGVAALKKGDLDAAESWHHKSLQIWEHIGDQGRIAGGYHQLGRIEQERGRFKKAIEWHERALATAEEIGGQGDIAKSCHELGYSKQELGQLDDAEAYYRRALAIKEHLNDRPAMTTTYHQLGALAHTRAIKTGDGSTLADAQEWYHKALAIQEELDDRPGKAKTYAQLGALAATVRKLDEAEQWFTRAESIFQELGYQASIRP